MENLCNFDFCLSKESVKYFKNLSYMGYTKNKNGSITQKEIAGGLRVKEKNKNIINLDVDLTTIITGDEEGVEIVPGLYNFHSHH